MSEHILKERVGLPVWDGEFVVDIKHLYPGDALTTEDLVAARQDEDEQAMLIEHNCYTQEELDEQARVAAEAEQATRSWTGDEPDEGDDRAVQFDESGTGKDGNA